MLQKAKSNNLAFSNIFMLQKTKSLKIQNN